MSVHPLSPALLLLAEAANKFRSYEAQHRAKNTAESLAKAEVNAEIAGRIEDFVRSTASTSVAAHRARATSAQAETEFTPIPSGSEVWVRNRLLSDHHSPNIWPGLGWPENHTPGNCIRHHPDTEALTREVDALRASATTGHGESVRAFRSHQDRPFLSDALAKMTMDYRGTVAENQPPIRGEIRVIDGRECRFIERELEGDKWEIIGPVVRK